MLHNAEVNASRVLLATMLADGVTSASLNALTSASHVHCHPEQKACVPGALNKVTRGAPESLDELHAARR